jgi:hypothetical protein
LWSAPLPQYSFLTAIRDCSHREDRRRSHTPRQGRRPTRLPTRRATAWTGTASSGGGCPPKGFQLRRSNDAAINDARRVCTRYAGGESEQQIIQDILQGSPGMTLNTASGFADTAISVYCPDGYVDHP